MNANFFRLAVISKALGILPLVYCLIFVVSSRSVRGAEGVVLPPAANVKVEFWQDIAPIFHQRCQSCHGPEKQMGGLRLDSRETALAGGYSGPVILPGNSVDSKLIH